MTDIIIGSAQNYMNAYQLVANVSYDRCQEVVEDIVHAIEGLN